MMKRLMVVSLMSISFFVGASQLETYQKSRWPQLEAAEEGNNFYSFPSEGKPYKMQQRIGIRPLTKLGEISNNAEMHSLLHKDGLPFELCIKHINSQGETVQWHRWTNPGADRVIALHLRAGEKLVVYTFGRYVVGVGAS